jgi:ribonuclease HI
MIDGRTSRRDLVIGAQTRTTVGRMELGVYTEAIAYHYYGLLNRVLTHAPYRVWIFSDSELTVKCGNKEYSRKTNVDLWQAFEGWERRGYTFRFRWVPRNSTPFHEMADELAGAARQTINGLQLPDETLYEYMPYLAEKPDGKTKLVECSKCRTPRLPTDEQCPICGHEEER